MNMIRALRAFALKTGLMSLLLLMIGCATLVNGSRQKIPVKTVPKGATVTAIGEKSIQSPGSLLLKRNRNYSILIDKKGYVSVEIHLGRTLTPWIWGNILTGGPIGAIVDFISNGAMDFSRDRIYVHLKPEQEK